MGMWGGLRVGMMVGQMREGEADRQRERGGWAFRTCDILQT